MESGTTGTWDHFPVNKQLKKQAESEEGDVSSSGGGGGEDATYDRCRMHLRDVILDEVARCDYFRVYKTVPVAGTVVAVRGIIDPAVGRIVVYSISDNVVIGYLPSKYNYIRACMADGFSYTGKVISSSISPIPRVYVDLDSAK